MAFFRSLEPFLRIGLGLFVLAVMAGLVELAARWLGIPIITAFVSAGVAALFLSIVVTAILKRKSR